MAKNLSECLSCYQIKIPQIRFLVKCRGSNNVLKGGVSQQCCHREAMLNCASFVILIRAAAKVSKAEQAVGVYGLAVTRHV
jgi:hypothetical protein